MMTTAALVLTLGACTPRPNGPEPTAEEFFEALATGDTSAAAQLADDPEAARVAMSQWYRAIRNSRDGREHADVDRVKAAAILKGSRSGS